MVSMLVQMASLEIPRLYDDEAGRLTPTTRCLLRVMLRSKRGAYWLGGGLNHPGDTRRESNAKSVL